ncbi:MAG: glucosamine-6-phosphate deaminase [Dehalococcoidia bacterium]
MDLRIVRHDMFAGACADAFLEVIDGFARPVVGLATGNSPIPLYDELRQRVYGMRVDLSAVRPFAIDEYGGRRDHHCSNHSFFERYWASIPGVEPVHEFNSEAQELAVECASFAVALEKAGGLDVVVLGIGANGHLAFNEPGTARDAPARVARLAPETMESARVCWQDETPAHGLTLGLRELLSARKALLLANGSRKAAIVARALRGEVGLDCPASFLQKHPGLTVVLDEAAARELSRREPGAPARG